MANFQYQSRPQEAWQQRSEQSGSQFIGFIKDSVDCFSPKKGENWIRILPPTWQNPRHYGHDIFVHYSVGPQNASVLCNSRMFNEKCPVCEAHQAAEAAGADDAYSTKPVRRVLVWLIDRAEKEQSIEAWAMPWTLDRDISKLSRDRQTGELYQIDHHINGYDVTFDREGDTPNVKYVGIQIARHPTPVEERFLEFISRNPVTGILIRRSYEEVKSLFEGGTGAVDNAPPPPQQQYQPPYQPPTQYQPPFVPNAGSSTQGYSAPPVAAAPPAMTAYPSNQPNGAPAPSWEQTAPVNPYCVASLVFQGQVIACAMPPNHAGDHMYERAMGPVQQQQPQQPPPPPQQPYQGPQYPQQPAPVAQPQFQQPAPPAPAPAPQQQAQPPNPTPIVSPRAASLRERFSNAGKK